MNIGVNSHYLIQSVIIIILILKINVGHGSSIQNSKSTTNGPLRLCFVEGRGTYKRGVKHCPTLEAKSNIECVIGVDRLDCVRRIHKGLAHFGVFSSEDLVAARWANEELLVVSELRFHQSPFEYEVVVVVDNEADINTVQDLKGSKFCHPGHGLRNHWTDVIANYFENTLVPKQCESDLSMVESRIKATAEFFGPTCKAGPWVSNPVRDRLLKKKYSSLCQICYNPTRCDVGDKHWGRRGPLYCLTSGTGDVAMARLDDVKSHFGYSGLDAQTDPAGYSYLCPDGHLQPLHEKRPCVWVEKPWPVLAAKRSHASRVEAIVDSLRTKSDEEWAVALLLLLESYHVNITSMDTSIPIDDYLDQAVGFQSSYSFPACNPSRAIVYCTTSLIEHAKCSWLQEAASVYGIEPNLQCIRAESMYECLDETKHQTVDVLRVDQDTRVIAETGYSLSPLLFEYSKFEDNYVVVAVVHPQSKFTSLKDLKGKTACFPSFEGAAYNSVLQTFIGSNVFPHTCTLNSKVKQYFSHKSCIWDAHQNNQSCPSKYRGDDGALQCLLDKGDVAFVSYDVYKKYTDNLVNAQHHKLELLCLNEPADPFCFLHWTPRGTLMINNATNRVRANEIYNSLSEMDKLFGKQYTAHTIPFTMFGPFDRKLNIMFRDTTDVLISGDQLMTKSNSNKNLELIYSKQKDCPNRVANKSSVLLLPSVSLALLVNVLTTIFVYKSL